MALDVGRLYRVVLRVPLRYVHGVRRAHGDLGQKMLLRDVEERLESSGFVGTVAILQDPTDNTRFTAIARYLGPVSRPAIEIVSAEEVEEPPEESPRTNPGVLDVGLTADEVQVVRRALAKEENPRHLYGLASSMEPFFPLAASLVRAKGTLLESRAIKNAETLAGQNAAGVQRLAEQVSVVTGGECTPQANAAWTGPVQGPAGAMLVAATRAACVESWPEVETMWHRFGTIRGPWGRLDRMRGAGLGAQSAQSAQASVAEQEAARLLMGAAPETTLGKWLQRKDFQRLWQRTSGVTLRDRLADFMSAAKESDHTHVPVADVLIARRREELAAYAARTRVSGQPFPLDVLSDEVKRVACAIVGSPEGDLSQYPAEVQNLARCVVKELRQGIWVVWPEDLYKALPPTGEEGFVSPTALQLALASQKPIVSRVSLGKRVPEVLASLSEPRGRIDQRQLMRAKHQMERAKRAIERRRWVEWHRRHAQCFDNVEEKRQ